MKRLSKLYPKNRMACQDGQSSKSNLQTSSNDNAESKASEDDEKKRRSSFSKITSLLSPTSRRQAINQNNIASARGIKGLLNPPDLTNYGELEDSMSLLEIGVSDQSSESAHGDHLGRLLEQSGKEADETEVTDAMDFSDKSLLGSSSHSVVACSPSTAPRRRASAPSSPYVIRKDKRGSSTKWVKSSDELCKPYLELNIQVGNKRSSNRNRQRRSSRSSAAVKGRRRPKSTSRKEEEKPNDDPN